MELGKIISAVRSGEPLAQAQVDLLDSACSDYPYSPLPPMLRLVCGAPLTDDRAAALRRRIALQVDDPRAIDALRGLDWASFYPANAADSEPQEDTSDAIDLFLRTYGNRTPEEDALLERMIFNPAPDYAEALAREEQENLPDEPADPDSPQGRIDAFILSRHPAAHAAPTEKVEADPQAPPIHKPTKEAPGAAADTLLSESLARVYIKQGKYQMAYSIIESLSAKFPRKNSYLKAQLSYLRKLILCSR